MFPHREPEILNTGQEISFSIDEKGRAIELSKARASDRSGRIDLLRGCQRKGSILSV